MRAFPRKAHTKSSAKGLEDFFVGGDWKKNLIFVIRISRKCYICKKVVEMGTERSKNTHGGRRQGAGRPRTNAKMYAFRADRELAQYIDGHENKTQFILNCIRSAQSGPTRLIVTPVSVLRSVSLPYVETRVAAGFPIPLDNSETPEDIELLKLLCPNPESTYLIRVEGDSMVDADIQSGDILIVDKSIRTPGPNRPALCELNGEYTIKYLVVHDGHGSLVPANSRYPEIEIKPGDDFNVWGTVTYVIHKPRS